MLFDNALNDKLLWRVEFLVKYFQLIENSNKLVMNLLLILNKMQVQQQLLFVMKQILLKNHFFNLFDEHFFYRIIKQKMKSTVYMFGFMILLTVAEALNLINNSNFSSHPTLTKLCYLLCPSNFYFQAFQSPYNGLLGWYQPTGKQLQIRTDSLSSSKAVADLCSSYPIELCQNISNPAIGNLFNLTIQYSANQDGKCMFLMIRVSNNSYNTSETCLSSHTIFTKNLLIQQEASSICIKSSFENVSTCKFGPKIYSISLTQICSTLNCAICNSSDICQSCINKFVLMPNFLCANCSLLISNCQICDTSETCQNCTNGFSLTVNFTCQSNTLSNTTNTTNTTSTNNTNTANQTTTNTTNTTSTNTTSTTTSTSSNTTNTTNPSDNSSVYDQNIQFNTEISPVNDFNPIWLFNTNFVIPSQDSGFPNLKQVRSKIELYIQGQLQQNAIIYRNQQNKLTIRVECTRYFTVNANIQILFKQSISFEGIRYILKTNNCSIPVSLTFNQNEVKVLNNVDILTGYTSSSIKYIFQYLKSFGLGYFIFNLFTFWNLTLLYHFLFIGTPTFVKYLSQSIFRNILLEGVISMLSLNSKFESISPSSLTQKIPPSPKSWYWFGQFGYTSNFYQNNYEAVSMLLVLCLKLIVFALIFKITGLKIFRYKTHQWTNQLQIESISYFPFLVIPAVLTLKSPQVANFGDKLNQMLQIIILFICLIVPFIRFTIQMNYEQQFNKSKKARKKRIRILFITLLYHCLNFSIPFLVAFQKPLLFFIVNTLILATQFIAFIIYRSSYHKCQFIMRFVMSLLFIVYHLIYLTFYIIDQIQEHFEISIAYKSQISKGLGLSLIFILLIGAFLQLVAFLIKSLYEIVEFLWTKIKDIHKKLISITPEEQEKNNNENVKKQQQIKQNKAQEKDQKQLSQIIMQPIQRKIQRKKAMIKKKKVQQTLRMKTILHENNIFANKMFEPFSFEQRKIKPKRFKIKNGQNYAS